MGLLAETKSRRKLNHDPNNTKWSRDTKTFGQKILRAQGWQPGEFLGAQNSAHAELHTAASASYIRVSLKDDVKGLGFSKRKEDEIAGLDEFSDLLSRLNGKTEAAVEEEKQARMVVKMNAYVQARYGAMRFVRGGLLVGDELKVEEKVEEEVAEGEEEEGESDSTSTSEKAAPAVKDTAEAETKKDKKSKKRKAESLDEDEDDSSAKDSDEKSKKRRKESKKGKKRSAEGSDDDTENLKSKKKDKKSKSKKSKSSSSEDDDEEADSAERSSKRKSKSKRDRSKSAESSDSDDDSKSKSKRERKEEKREKKERKRQKKEEKKRKKREAEIATPVVAAPPRPLNPLRVRSRFLAAKREAMMNDNALNKIWMVKA
ncbi:telomerase inhibitor [Amphichorda felina]